MSFRVKKYIVRTDKFHPGQKISAVFLSDLHLTEHGKKNSRLIDEILSLRPDLVLVGGDMVTGKEECPTTVAEELLSILAKKFPVYYALGNHEKRLKEKTERFKDRYALYLRRLKAAGVIVLDNEHLEIRVQKERISIYGLTLPLVHYHRFTRHILPIQEIYDSLGTVNKNNYSILLAHHPRFADTYFEWGADLILSGHIHGGVMRFFHKAFISPDFQLFPKYGYGRFVRGWQNLLISGGLGEHTIPFRIFNPKELLLIEIVQEVSHGDSR